MTRTTTRIRNESYSIVPKATFAIIDFNTKRRIVLDSDGNLINTNIDPDEFQPKLIKVLY
jgi:hypothetical protein